MSTATAVRSEFPVLTDGEFTQFQRLIYKESGISLLPSKHTLVAARLARRVRELQLPTFGAYYRLVAAGDASELRHMLDAITTNETQFFREAAQFELLSGACCAEWRRQADEGARPRRVRVWSAACSTGEEPYSIAMVLHDQLSTHGWSIAIEASDLSTRALARARAGVWPTGKLDGVPSRFLRRHFQRGVGPETGRAKVGPAIATLVDFRRINLRDDVYPVDGRFDAIFCRNALIYFDAVSRAHVLDRLIARLVPGGLLFLGHAESLIGTRHALQTVMPSVYRQPAGTAPDVR